MKTFVFDMDDTIYDQLIPFKKALEESGFSTINDIPALYKESRLYSDSVFESTQNGSMTNELMRRLRIQKPLENRGILMNDREADFFQARYAYHLDHLELHPDIQVAFNALNQNGIPFFVLTNGPSDHQWKKVKALDLETHLPSSRIIVSGDIGHYKPSKEIFKFIENLYPGEFIMIGDSLPNDIMGARNVGWDAIWFNHRRRDGNYEGLTLFSFSQIKAYVLNTI